MRTNFLLVAIVSGGLGLSRAEEGKTVPYRIHGHGWVESGRIMSSSDSLLNTASQGTLNVTGSWLQSIAADVTVEADLGEKLEAAFGFGAYRATHTIGSYYGLRRPLYLAVSLYKNYITEARLTYFQGERQAPGFSVTIGNFHYKYNADVKNLGAYLLRGPVYPGLLFGGFQDGVDTSRSNVFGASLHHALGNFSQDLIFKNEWDLPPTFDWSVAYVAKYKAFGALEVGGGVNFYRLIPYSSNLETPGHLEGDKAPFIEVDTVSNDTTFFTHQGLKVMGMFSLDLKRFLAFDKFGPNDLRLYGEAAILGTKNYGTLYNDVKKRIPAMAGFNFPVFGFLDYLSLEVEWYGSPYRNDLANIGNLNGVADWTNLSRPTPSPVPVKQAYKDSTEDNLKWSLFAEKTVRNHIRFMGQVANDHYRPRPASTGLISADGGTAEAFTNPRDWYYMFRVGFFF